MSDLSTPASSVSEPAAVLPGAEAFSADGGPVGLLVLHGFTGNPAASARWPSPPPPPG